MKIIEYQAERKDEWDRFINGAKNSHFFFKRDYMEYHSDRFRDCSLLIYNDKGRLMAVLPANITGDIVQSHGGLTFGGFITDSAMTAVDMLRIFQDVKTYLRHRGIKKLIYKCMPAIYHKYPSEEDRYALFRQQAVLVRRDLSATVYLPKRYDFQERRRRAVKKARKNNIQVIESHDYESYMGLLAGVLLKYHDTNPVHTAEEIDKLAKSFPNNIKLYVAYEENKLLAGTIVFDNGNTIHTQYLANSDTGRQLGALDLVIDFLINDIYADRQYFDFGISNEQQGWFLNEGLIAQKEGFGARGIVHDVYELTI